MGLFQHMNDYRISTIDDDPDICMVLKTTLVAYVD